VLDELRAGELAHPSLGRVSKVIAIR